MITVGTVYMSIEDAPVKEIIAMTGYVRGGVSPVGTRKPYPVFLDETADLWDVISVSAGVRGFQIIVAPNDLARTVDAVRAEIAKWL